MEVAEEVLQVGDSFLGHFGLLDEVLLLLTNAVIFEFVDLVADHGYVYLVEFVDGLEVLLHLVEVLELLVVVKVLVATDRMFWYHSVSDV